MMGNNYFLSYKILIIHYFHFSLLLIADEHHPDWITVFMKNRDGKIINHNLMLIEDGKLRIITRTAEICYHKVVDGIETYNLQ